MKNKYINRLLFIDTETGGQDPNKHSLFSIGLVVWDKHEGILDQMELFIKSEQYVYTKEAININHFEVQNHEQKAVKPKEAIRIIDSFLSRNFIDEYKVPIAGHNVQFDVNFLKKLYYTNNASFSNRFSHRIVDTYSIARFLVDVGFINLETISSSELFRNLNIKVNERHSALSDAFATAELYSKLITLFRSKWQDLII